MRTKKKRILISIYILIAIVIFFFALSLINTESIAEQAKNYSLPVLTIIVALIDGINPCTFLLFGLMLSLLVSVSESRKKMILVASVFIIFVFFIYFAFMSAWISLFSFVKYSDIFRYIVAFIAIIAGLINWKEFIWYRKGFSLMMTEKQKSKFDKMLNKFKNVIEEGSYIALAIASITLAVFTSMIEIPCTIGLPVIYSSILAKKYAIGSLGNILYLLLYNLIYVLPLILISLWFIFTFESKVIERREMQLLKLITGVIMVILGIILLFFPNILI